jgi:hypothetical protein
MPRGYPRKPQPKKEHIKQLHVIPHPHADLLLLNLNVSLTADQENYIRENAWMPRKTLAREIGISRLQLCHKIDLLGAGMRVESQRRDRRKAK